jgi:hypothetical protein
MRKHLASLLQRLPGTVLLLLACEPALAQTAPPGFDQPLPNSTVAFMGFNGSYIGTIDSGARTGTLLQVTRSAATIGASVLRTVPLTSIPSGGGFVHGQPNVLFADVLKTEGRVLYITADNQDFSVPIPLLISTGLGKYTEDASGEGVVTLGRGTVAVVDIPTRTAIALAAVLPTPTGAANPPDPGQFARGADGNLYFTETAATDSNGIPVSEATANIGRLNPAGTFTQFPVPTPYPGTYGGSQAPFNTTITTGADGNIWVLETLASPRKIASLATTGANAGQFTEFPLPAGGSNLLGIASGADGNLWVKDYTGKIYQITLAGSVTTFAIPTQNFGSDVEMVPGPDGAMWFLEDSKVGRITTTGTITEYPLPVQQVNGTPVYPYDLQIHEDGSGGFFEFTTGMLDLFVVPQSASPIVSAVLPSSRSVVVGGTATVFATMINSGSTTATACHPSLGHAIPALFGYQTTDPATNALTGSPDTPADVPAGKPQTFVLSFAVNAPFYSTDTPIGFACSNVDAAQSVSGVNTVLLSGSATPVPDLVALAATPGNTGTMTITGTTGSAAFAVATVNVGAAGALTATPSATASGLPLTLSICQTDPSTGQCDAPPTPSVTATIAASATPTFAIFGTASAAIPFAPAVNRVAVQFTDASGSVRGATSVAVQTQ